MRKIALLIAVLTAFAACADLEEGTLIEDAPTEIEARSDELLTILSTPNMTWADITQPEVNVPARAWVTNYGSKCYIEKIEWEWRFDGVGSPGCTYPCTFGQPYPVEVWMCIDNIGYDNCVQVGFNQAIPNAGGTTFFWFGRPWNRHASALVTFWFKIPWSTNVWAPLQGDRATAKIHCYN